MAKLLTGAGVVLGAAVWFLLFVILGIGLGTAFIAGGIVLAAGVLAAGMVAGGRLRAVLDAPLSSPGLLLGIAAFVILEVVLSAVPMWVGVVSGLGVTGVYGIADAAMRTSEARDWGERGATHQQPSHAAPAGSYAPGARGSRREVVGAR